MYEIFLDFLWIVFPATLILIGLIISFILGLFFVTLVSNDEK